MVVGVVVHAVQSTGHVFRAYTTMAKETAVSSLHCAVVMNAQSSWSSCPLHRALAVVTVDGTAVVVGTGSFNAGTALVGCCCCCELGVDTQVPHIPGHFLRTTSKSLHDAGPSAHHTSSSSLPVVGHDRQAGRSRHACRT